MKYAEVNGTKVEAAKGVKGLCPVCDSELIPKCGTRKINHWAHKGIKTCDSWWEPETEWHRSWKNMFPVEWQETIIIDEKTGVKHIADICTEHNLVIEFQHSHITPEECAKRENFYQNMAWVVDGMRLKRDYPRFCKGRRSFRNTEKQGFYLVDFPEESFPAAWLERSVPVIFDFKGLETVNNVNDSDNLYCLLPHRKGRYAILAVLHRKAFINTAISGEWSTKLNKFIQNLFDPIPKQKILPTQPQTKMGGVGPTYYFDPRKSRFVKRKRF